MSFFTRLKIKGLHKKIAKVKKASDSSQVTDAQRQKEIDLFMQLVKLYSKNQYNKKIPNAQDFIIECYRQASDLGDVDAQYTVSQMLIERGKFWMNLATTIFNHDINKKYSQAYFEEGFAYLKAAEEAGNPLATRLHGLVLINGWGVEKNENEGFKLVVNSIDQEKSWDNATKILEEAGLNKPEFFNSIMSAKAKREQ